MSGVAYSIQHYVDDLRTIVAEAANEGEIVDRVKPLAKRLAAAPGWLRPEHRQCNPEQGFGVHLLHEEPDHSLAVFVIAWLPDRGTLPHNHKTWAVVVGLEGQERESFWLRRDDGSRLGHAEIERAGERLMREGDVSACLPEDIHGVWNCGGATSLSLHTYGRHINHTGRSEFDPLTSEERPMIVAVERSRETDAAGRGQPQSSSSS